MNISAEGTNLLTLLFGWGTGNMVVVVAAEEPRGIDEQNLGLLALPVYHS